ncbi:MAG: hypothetical protein EOO77_30160 [Oxalobacteraceae bacterium]|nr:MAG: hypothetical protein EOO77_30160 [Oxalobacteraceae bacterium]
MSETETLAVRNLVNTIDNALTEAVNQGVSHTAIVEVFEVLLEAVKAEQAIIGLDWKITNG